MKLGFDLDGVIVNSPQEVVNYVNERLGFNLTMDDFKTYSMEDALPNQFRWIISAAFRDPTMWKKVTLIDGAYETIKSLYEEGHDIYFVTSSLPINLHKKIKHLSRNLNFFPEDYVWKHTVNTQNKQLLRLDVLCDDGLFNLTGDRDYFSICMNMPYNQTTEIIPNFTRARNWDEIYDKIHMVENLMKENKMNIKIKYFDNEIDKIENIGGKSDWYDLRAAETVSLKTGEFKLIPLGVGMILPDGYEANIVPRSSTFKNYGIIQTNHYGVIDNSYSGDNDQWMMPVYATRDVVINKNDRICQFRINKKQPVFSFEETEHLNEIDRGGFGSTGTK